MRAFLSSVVGAAMLILLLYLYIAWYNLKDLDYSFSSYVKMNHDVYRRAELENAVYNLLKKELVVCDALLARGGDLKDCSTLANDSLRALFLSYGIVPPPGDIVEPVLKPDIHFVVVKEVKGSIGDAEYKLPLGAEVGPFG